MAFDHTHLPTTRRPGGGRARRALVACLTLAATAIPPAAASASDAPPPGETQPGSGQPGAVLVPGPKPPGHADTDFDGDGFADLAIGTPGDRVGGGARGGTVRVLYGAATGLGSVRIQVWSQNSTGVQDSSEEGDQFGASVETGDFDVDGFSDLAIGAPGESYVRGLQHDGVVHVIYGSAAGLSSAGNQVWSQDTPGVPFGAQSNDHFGRTLSAGDFDGDGADDLVIGTPDEDLGLGAVHVLPGSIAGLSSTGAQVWTQESPGIADAAESTDRFGMALATGDFDGDGSDDLAVGVDEAVDWVAIGAVHVIYGSAGGLSSAGSQLWSQGSPGIAGGVDTPDHFGHSLATGDLDASGHDELIVGAFDGSIAPGMTRDGVIHIIPGSSAGLIARGSEVWGKETPGVDGAASGQNEFGASIAVGDFGGSPHLDVAVGAIGATVSGHEYAGHVHVLYGSAAGLDTGNDQIWSQDSPGIADQAEQVPFGMGEGWGSGLAVGDYDGDGFGDLVAATPWESFAQPDSFEGIVQLLRGSAAGLSASGTQTWMEAVGSLSGTPEPNDHLGASVA